MRVTDLSNNPDLREHTITKHIRDCHINVEDNVLKERFSKERNEKTKLYSKFENEDVAADSIATALERNIRKIKQWYEEIQGAGFLKFFVKLEEPIGYGFNRNNDRFELSNLAIILCRNKNGGFRIKSAYPC